jgi:hypothetical protein
VESENCGEDFGPQSRELRGDPTNTGMAVVRCPVGRFPDAQTSEGSGVGRAGRRAADGMGMPAHFSSLSVRAAIARAKNCGPPLPPARRAQALHDRARSHCRFVLPFIHFITYLLSESASLFLN